jgi:hypothetical protein
VASTWQEPTPPIGVHAQAGADPYTPVPQQRWRAIPPRRLKGVFSSAVPEGPEQGFYDMRGPRSQSGSPERTPGRVCRKPCQVRCGNSAKTELRPSNHEVYPPIVPALLRNGSSRSRVWQAFYALAPIADTGRSCRDQDPAFLEART